MVAARTNTKVNNQNDYHNSYDDNLQDNNIHNHNDNIQDNHNNNHDHNNPNPNPNPSPNPPPERIAIVRWTAGLGAVTAEAVAEHLGVGVASARARLMVAARERLLTRCSPLRGRPALYTVTRAGLRKADVHGLDPCRVSASNALHLIECAHAAAALERCYPDHRVQGERELRSEERELRRPLASAELDMGPHGDRSRETLAFDRSRETLAFDRSRETLTVGSHPRFGQHPRFAQPYHRPDLVLWPRDPAWGLPVAVEVELTVKAPERLVAICRAWARARCVAGVLYLSAPAVQRAVQRAIDKAHAHERVVVVPLDALPEWPARPAERTVPSSA